MRKNSKKFQKSLFLVLWLLPWAVWAGPVTVNVTNGTLQSWGADKELENKINSEFKVPDMSNFLKAMSNAQAIANKGQGVSYATEHSLFVLGGSAGLGASGSLSDATKSSGGLPQVGMGVVASGMVGFSFAQMPVPQLGFIDLKRLTLFANYFSYSNDSLVDSLTIKTSSFGLHLQYKLVEGKRLPLGLFSWGGLALTTGFESSNNTLNYKIGTSISTDVSVSGSNHQLTWTPDASSALSLESSAFTIPIEISTSVRLLYVLSLFGGLGVDINTGKTSIKANMTGTISSSGPFVNNSNVGNAALNITEEQGPNVGQLRFFVGPQLNLVPLKNTNLLSVYAQFNASTGGNYGAHAGARIAW
jgi:hypothetical protein